MTTLYDATRPVKSPRIRCFGRGLMPAAFAEPAPFPTFADAAWLARESVRRAAEARALDVQELGLIPADVAAGLGFGHPA